MSVIHLSDSLAGVNMRVADNVEGNSENLQSQCSEEADECRVNVEQQVPILRESEMEAARKKLPIFKRKPELLEVRILN